MRKEIHSIAFRFHPEDLRKTMEMLAGIGIELSKAVSVEECEGCGVAVVAMDIFRGCLVWYPYADLNACHAPVLVVDKSDIEAWVRQMLLGETEDTSAETNSKEL